GGAGLAAAALQSQIVSHAEDPSTQIRSPAATPQVLKQRQKNLLHDLFAVGNRQPEACQVAQQRLAPQVEQGDNFLFERTAALFEFDCWQGGHRFECSVPGALAQTSAGIFRYAPTVQGFSRARV